MHTPAVLQDRAIFLSAGRRRAGSERLFSDFLRNHAPNHLRPGPRTVIINIYGCRTLRPDFRPPFHSRRALRKEK